MSKPAPSFFFRLLTAFTLCGCGLAITIGSKAQEAISSSGTTPQYAVVPTIAELQALTSKDLPAELIRIKARPLSERARDLIRVSDQTGELLVRTAQGNRLPAGFDHWFEGRLVRREGQLILDQADFSIIRDIPEGLPADAFAVCADLRTAQEIALNEPGTYHPVRIEGVVTFLDPDGRSMRIQDDTGGFWVSLSRTDFAVPLGAWVRLHGFVVKGDYAPVISRPKVEILHTSERPEPLVIPGFDFVNGRFDGRFVSIAGRVRSQELRDDTLRLTVMAEGLPIPVVLPRESSLKLPRRMVDTEVRVAGICSAFYNDNQQFGGFEMLVPTFEDLKLLRTGGADPFDAPKRSINDLITFRPGQPLLERTLVEGTVSLVIPDQRVFIRDAGGTLEVRTHRTADLKPGDLIAASGHPQLQPYGQFLANAEVRFVGRGTPAHALPLSLAEQDAAFYHADLVQLRARYLNSVAAGSSIILMLESDGRVFEAVARTEDFAGQPPGFETGSEISVTGVLSMGDETGAAEIFRLFLRGPDDLQLLRAPPWWNTRRALALIALVATAALVVLLWATSLRRRVRAQTTMIRARLEKEAELERDYRNLFENSNDFIFKCDHRGRILSANPAAARSLGYSLDELNRMSVFQLVSEQDHPNLKRLYRENRRRSHFSTAEVHLRTKSGEARIFEFAADVLAQGDALPIVQGIGRDITERRETEEKLRTQEAKLEQARKMEAIGTLAGGIAHDFNNILTGMLGYVELIQVDLDPTSSMRHDLEQVRAAGLRAKDLVRQILAYSRSMEHERHSVRLSEITLEAGRLLRASIPSTIELDFNLESNCPPVFADSTQLHQVLMNLATNAYQAMRESGGTVTIGLKTVRHTSPVHSDATGDTLPPGNYVEWSIRDNGPGMEPGVRRRIFEPYFTTKKVGEGSGMGLAVVHGIVQSHGGTIWVESAMGEGSCFRVLLPPHVESPTAASTPSMNSSSPGGQRGEVLLVDDEPMIARLGRRMLERLGFTVETTHSAKDALLAFEKAPDRFDLIITDQTMPHMTGITLVKKIHQIRPEIPAILCTGYSEALEGDAARKAGAVGLLNKPFELAELSATVARALPPVSQ